MRRHRCRVGRSGWCEGIRHECQCNLQPMHSEAVRALVTTLRCHVRNVAKLDARTILLTVHQERDFSFLAQPWALFWTLRHLLRGMT